MEIRGHKISVGETRFKRKFERNVNHDNERTKEYEWRSGSWRRGNWVDGKSHKEVVTRSMGSHQPLKESSPNDVQKNSNLDSGKKSMKDEQMRSVRGVLCQDTMEWLQSSEEYHR